MKPTISVAPVSSTTSRQLLDARDVEVDRLLAENRLAGPGETLDQLGVGVGRRADDHGVDVLGCFDRIDGADLRAISRRDRDRGRPRQCVRDGDQPCIADCR